MLGDQQRSVAVVARDDIDIHAWHFAVHKDQFYLLGKQTFVENPVRVGISGRHDQPINASVQKRFDQFLFFLRAPVRAGEKHGVSLCA